MFIQENSLTQIEIPGHLQKVVIFIDYGLLIYYLKSKPQKHHQR